MEEDKKSLEEQNKEFKESFAEYLKNDTFDEDLLSGMNDYDIIEKADDKVSDDKEEIDDEITSNFYKDLEAVIKDEVIEDENTIKEIRAKADELLEEAKEETDINSDEEEQQQEDVEIDDADEKEDVNISEAEEEVKQQEEADEESSNADEQAKGQEEAEENNINSKEAEDKQAEELEDLKTEQEEKEEQKKSESEQKKEEREEKKRIKAEEAAKKKEERKRLKEEAKEAKAAEKAAKAQEKEEKKLQAKQLKEEKKQQKGEKNKSKKESLDEKANEQNVSSEAVNLKLVAMVLAIGIIIIVGGGIGIISIIHGRSNSRPSTQEINNNITGIQSGIMPGMSEQEIYDWNNKTPDADKFEVNFNKNVEFENGSSAGYLRLINPKYSVYPLSVDLYISESRADKLVYKSNILYPQQYLANINLDVKLDKGTYTAYAVFKFYDKDGKKEIGKHRANMNITIKND